MGAYSSGPPIHGAPWLLRGAPYGLGGVATGTSSTPSTPPTPVRSGRGKPLLRRDPKADRRPGRNWEILVEIINSLMLQGYIYEDPNNVWNLQANSIIGGSGQTGTFTDTF